MEQASETHVLEEQAEGVDNKSDSNKESKKEETIENVDKNGVIVLEDENIQAEDENITVEEQDIQNNLEISDNDNIVEVEEVNEEENEVIESTDVDRSKDDEVEKIESPNNVDNNSKKRENNEEVVEVKEVIEYEKVESVEGSVKTSIEDVVELVDDVNNDENDPQLPDKVILSNETENNEVTQSNLSSQIKVETNVVAIESFEKRIENLNILSEKENVLTEEKQNTREKGIETKKVERTEEKENTNYLENPTNPTSSYLNKIFTPAEDAPTPKNRKNFASSAFYSPNHPTVEDQVNLARRISNSLSDISNQQSKGQTMYVNRKKRSVKWVHENNKGQSDYIEEEISQDTKPKNFPLKVVMNPKGKVQDLSSLPNEEFFTDTGLLSPDKCKELISGLNEPKGKGAELFAKRRKRAEKWAAENEVQQNNSYNQKQEPVYQDRFSEVQQAAEIYQQQKQEQFYNEPYHCPSQFNQIKKQQVSYQPNKPLNQRELAYKPSVAQGWKSSPIFLPTESEEKLPISEIISSFELLANNTDLYVPKEIPLDSYNTPPNTDNFIPKPYIDKHVSFGVKNPWTQANGKNNTPSYFKVSSEPISSPWHEMEKQAPKSYTQPNWAKPKAENKQFLNYNPALTHCETLQPQTQYPSQRPYQFRSPQPSNSLPSTYNQNFNTAARGWNGSMKGNCYKPITFGNQPRKTNCMQYTDF